MPEDAHAPSASAVVHGAAEELGGFKKVILRGNVVQALVKDFITPLLGAFSGVPDFSGWVLTVLGARLLVGDFLNALLSFLLIAAVIYFLVVLPVTRLMDRYRPAPQPAPTKDCPECLSEIPQAARRCPECTAQLAPPSAEVAAALRRVAAPSGADVADEAARVLAERLHGRQGAGPQPEAPG